MTGHATRIKGYVLKDGKVVKGTKHLDVSARLRQRASKKVKVIGRASAAITDSAKRPSDR